MNTGTVINVLNYLKDAKYNLEWLIANSDGESLDNYRISLSHVIHAIAQIEN